MILKASERGGAKQLAAHLLNTHDNEHVEVHDLRGFVSEDVTGAFKEAQAVSMGTRCKNFLFSLSLSPPPSASVPIAVFEDALDRIEARTGLGGHPRVVIFHEKEGRRHAHCVWSRIDAGTMTARNLSHYKSKLRNISRELFLEHDWTMPRGLMNSKERDPRNFSLAEWQQAKRLGRDARDLKSEVQECWAVSDGRAAFALALEERGMSLARGDRRGFVAVTTEGEVLSLSRYTGRKTKDLRARLGEPGDLPGVEETKARLSEAMTAGHRQLLVEARERMTQSLKPLETERRDMVTRHRALREAPARGQAARREAEARTRAARLHKGLRGLWSRLTGTHARMVARNERDAQAAALRDRRQKDALIEAQHTERQVIQRDIAETRSAYATLFRDLRRDACRVRNALAPTFDQGDREEAVPRTPRDAFARAATPETRLKRLRDPSERPRRRRRSRGQEPTPER